MTSHLARGLAAALVVMLTTHAAAREPVGIPVAPQQDVDAAIDASDDLDTYTFEALRGSRLELRVKAPRGGGLEPALWLIDRDGHVLPAITKPSANGRSVRLIHESLPDTGIYAVAVFGADGSVGTYRLQIRSTPKRRLRPAPLELGPAGSAGVVAAVADGTRLDARLTAKGGTFEVLGLRDVAAATTVAGADAFPATKRGRAAKGKVTCEGQVRDVTLVVRAGPEPVKVRAKLDLRHPKVKRGRMQIDAREPVVTALDPPQAWGGDRIAVLGRDFSSPWDVEGAPLVLFGDTPGLDVTWMGPNRLEVTVPPGTPGGVQVLVFDAVGHEAPVSGPFTYVEPADPEEPLPEPGGLLAHWSFDGPDTGSAEDVTGNGHDGALNGSALLHDGSLELDGVSGHVEHANPRIQGASALDELEHGTISIWFRCDGWDNGGAPAETLPLFYFGSSPENGEAGRYGSLQIYVGHGNLSRQEYRSVYFTVADTDGRIELCFDSGIRTVQAGQWTHYAVVIGPDGHRGYVDGVEFTRNYNAGTTPDDSAFFDFVPHKDTLRTGHGRFELSGQWWRWNGEIGDVRIYHRPLSAEEIEQLAESR
jgi:hypothetical protein